MKRASSYPSWLSNLNRIIEIMIPRLQDKDGGFKDEGNGNKGCFSTIEGLYPLLLHPQKEKWAKNIITGIKYLLKNAKNGKISPTPEYSDIVEDCCVDSMAYGLYILTLSRHYIVTISQKNKEKRLLTSINTQIKHCIKYIEENQNGDGGWPLVKDVADDLKSRTYSTALVIFALSNCGKTDFEEYKKDVRTLIREGVNFLIKYNRCDDGGWFFSLPRNGDVEELAKLKKKPSVNLTAVVVFSLAHLLRTEWKFGWDVKILKVVQEGAKYIHEKTFEWRQNKKGQKIIILHVYNDCEPVDYPTYDRTGKGRIIKIKGYNKNEGFIFPYEMILPALVLAPGYSVKSKELMTLRDLIYSKLEQIGRSRTKPEKLYDFSEKIFALLYHGYIETLLEEGLDRFVKTADVLRCVIDGYDSCPQVRDAVSMCPYSENINSCPHVSSTEEQTILQKIKNNIKNQWRKLHGGSKRLLIQVIIVVCTIPILLYLESKQKLFGLTSSAIWGIYGMLQVFVTIGLQRYYRAIKDKNRGDNLGKKE